VIAVSTIACSSRIICGMSDVARMAGRRRNGAHFEFLVVYLNK
jgi:hypothetical protein